MNRALVLTWMLGALLCAGCDQAAPTVASTTPRAPSIPGLPTQAQGKLQTMKLYIGANEMVTELALTPLQQETGMMFRTNMDENAGMLFPLPYTRQASFWMMNCPYPLSAAYISEDGVIQEIHDLQPYNTNAVVSAGDNIRFVLETPQGWFARHHVGTNVAIATERGPLMETFFGRR